MSVAQQTPPGYGDYAHELGRRLAAARRARGLTQRQTADRAGISTYTYFKIESGASRPGTPANPRLRTLLALSQVLHVQPSDLLPPIPHPIADA